MRDYECSSLIIFFQFSFSSVRQNKRTFSHFSCLDGSGGGAAVGPPSWATSSASARASSSDGGSSLPAAAVLLHVPRPASGGAPAGSDWCLHLLGQRLVWASVFTLSTVRFGRFFSGPCWCKLGGAARGRGRLWLVGQTQFTFELGLVAGCCSALPWPFGSTSFLCSS